ncbi:hypothetical protein OCU04_006141 [Sclerotinia nivalis]|uniref:Uncharacterized protein n=1 Tax=Sclerotinia nivalis TaxID=352851 RepID=A0A9X0AMD8_9HELO|nr:hypothetical protein OCU04_006141 [Sclerotinia nivalis]
MRQDKPPPSTCNPSKLSCWMNTYLHFSHRILPFHDGSAVVDPSLDPTSLATSILQPSVTLLTHLLNSLLTTLTHSNTDFSYYSHSSSVLPTTPPHFTYPCKAKPFRQSVLSRPRPHKFCEVWLVSGTTLAWVQQRHPDPGQGCKPRQASLDLFKYFPLLYLMDLCTAPLPPFSRSSQSHLFLFYLTSHSLKVFLISLFAHLYTGSWLSSTPSQATSITKRVCFYITFSQVHSSTHHAHFRCPTLSTCRRKVTIPTYPHREASLF